ncbi:MAG TPA: group II truncated hemoglobin [Gemmatimonadales bacterium]|nr:group II truncated hemoglobin [Gemmatimonadales bacterium]
MPADSPPDFPPPLYQWAGGVPAIERLMDVFYRKVGADCMLAPLFAQMSDEHPRHVAHFVAEVLGGPPLYSQQRGGHPHMIARHLDRHLTQPQRAQWVRLLLEAADEAGLPDDPEFRSALVAYLEWGSRLAVINSQAGATVDRNAPMPHWGWGVPGGPYRG